MSNLTAQIVSVEPVVADQGGLCKWGIIIYELHRGQEGLKVHTRLLSHLR